MNWESFHQYPFKMKCLILPLNIHLLQITLRENSKPRFLHMRKVLKTIRIIDSSNRIWPWEHSLWHQSHYWQTLLWNEIYKWKNSTMLAKLHDKYDKRTKKEIQPMSVEITEISSKQSVSIQNEVLDITSKYPSSEYNFERKPQDKISPYNQSFEQL